MTNTAPQYIGFFEFYLNLDAWNLHYYMGYPEYKVRMDIELPRENWELWDNFDKFFQPTTDYDKLLCVEECREFVWDWKPLYDPPERSFLENQLWFEHSIKPQTLRDQFNVEFVLLDNWMASLCKEISELGS